MLKLHCRYTPEMLNSLGYPDTTSEMPDESIANQVPADMEVIALGNFGNIIKTIFQTETSELPNVLRVAITDNTPESVKQFVQNILSCDIPALKAAPDDETAFDMILPRSCQSLYGKQLYTDHLKTAISRYRREYQATNSVTPETSD